MKHLSFWEKEKFIFSDISIIGGGIVGLISAIEAKTKFPKRKVSVFERSLFAQGASSKNAGFACFGSITEIDDDLQHRNETEIIDLIRLRWSGLQLLQEYIGKESTVDLEFNGGYEVFDTKENDHYGEFAHRLDYFNELIFRATGLKGTFCNHDNNFGFHVHDKLFYNQFEGQLNPVKLLLHLQKRAINIGVNIFYGMELKSWYKDDGYRLQFEHDQAFFTDQLIIATNAFSNYFFKDLDLVPYRNQVLITTAIPDLKWKGTFHFNKGYTYFRNVGQRVLIGGFRNVDMITEQTNAFGVTDKIQNSLESFLRHKLNIIANIDHRWSGILATGARKSAIVEHRGEGLYLAIRLGGMGVAIGARVAKDVVDLLD